ncbi:MAG: hypothetical protein AUK35_02280 [Zetaproteobacteria bacterium CG2_30_46_52]|nr:MAG: hypothetical protein AUK35_02280 [Zetaproteobacteria bacterium CG2_30_46_52]
MEQRLELEDVKCNFCGSDKHQKLFSKQGSLSAHMFQIVACADCGLVFVNPRLTTQQVADLYQQAYFQGDGFDGSVHYEQSIASEAESNDAERALSRISSLYPATAKILEIGPGMGGFMQLAKNRGYAVQGLELSDYAAKQLQARGLDVLQGSLPTSALAAQSFDVIVAVEVIEHVTDPMTFFKEVNRLLKPGGLFYYETGNVACENAKTLGADWDYIMPEGHLYYFSPQIMGEYLAASGFAVAYPNWSPPQRTAFRLLRAMGLTDNGEVLPQGWRGKISRKLLFVWDKMTGANDAFPIGIKR